MSFQRYSLVFALTAAMVLELAGCSKPEPPTLSLYRAVHTGDLNQVQRHLYWGAEVNAADVNGDFPLHVAARDGRVNIARELIEHGADPLRQNASGATAMDVALLSGKTQVAKMLLQHGAKLDAQAALIELVKAGVSDRDSLELLLRRGASLERTDAEGQGPLLLAVARGHLETVSRLIILGAPVDQVDRAGQSPMAVARRLAAEGHENAAAIIDLLERNGAGADTGPTAAPEANQDAQRNTR